MIKSNRFTVICIFTGLTIGISGCSSNLNLSASENEPNLQVFYGQKLSWQACDDFECATVKVPLNWKEPQGKTIEVPLVKYKATGEKLGSLLFNPGGPGASGVDHVKSIAPTYISEELKEKYDLIGFDPRGVGKTNPIKCLTNQEQEEITALNINATTLDGLEKLREQNKIISKKCVERTGTLLENVDTRSVAKDMDVIRDALGDSKINYQGSSYGTYLGATYIDLFPKNVGKFVLDAAFSPENSRLDFLKGYAGGFENALKDYMSASTIENIEQKIKTVFQQLSVVPAISAEGKKLNDNNLASAITISLYQGKDIWPKLDAAFDKLFQGNPEDFLKIASLSMLGGDQSPDAYYPNFATQAINCLDHAMPTSDIDLLDIGKELEQVAPILGKYMLTTDALCSELPTKSERRPQKVTSEGDTPVLVIGGTKDPATPYKWAQSLNEQLGKSVLLTVNTTTHGSYPLNKCIQKKVDDYFIKGVVPDKKENC